MLVGAACVVLCSASCVKTSLDNVITKCPKYLISNKTVDKSVLKEHNLLLLFFKGTVPYGASFSGFAPNSLAYKVTKFK